MDFFFISSYLTAHFSFSLVLILSLAFICCSLIHYRTLFNFILRINYNSPPTPWDIIFRSGWLCGSTSPLLLISDRILSVTKLKTFRCLLFEIFVFLLVLLLLNEKGHKIIPGSSSKFHIILVIYIFSESHDFAPPLAKATLSLLPSVSSLSSMSPLKSVSLLPSLASQDR